MGKIAITSNNFFVKETFIEHDIDSLISSKAEESLYLEFKSSGSFGVTDQKKNEIAKDVSAFANSDGGILIYGLNEVNHMADSHSFVDGNQFTKEWLENVITSRITRRIPYITVHPIRYNNDFLKTVYVVKVGRSYQAPHMTSEKKFYKRLNFQVLQMEEYEIRDAYNRTNKTALNFGDLLITSNGNSMQAGRLNEARYNIGFQIKNDGSTIENQYKLEFAIPLQLMQNPDPLILSKIRRENGVEIYSIPNKSPLFQEEITTLVTYPIVVNGHTKSYLDQPLRAKLYFSGGIVIKEFDLKALLEYLGKPAYLQF